MKIQIPMQGILTDDQENSKDASLEIEQGFHLKLTCNSSITTIL